MRLISCPLVILHRCNPFGTLHTGLTRAALRLGLRTPGPPAGSTDREHRKDTPGTLQIAGCNSCMKPLLGISTRYLL